MITLQNEGLLEIEFLKTMGVNVKENENAIGYFGTGLKYAIAVFLREGVKFSLFIGDNEYEFYTEEKVLRGKTFSYCFMAGPHDTTDLNLTTELGKNWSLWQAYRELHSNCLDEMGTIVEEKLSPRQGYTTFYIENEGLFNVDDVFLSYRNLPLLYKNGQVEIYEGSSNCIYYKGIRAKDLTSPSKYTYNVIKECILTEDRLICYDFDIKESINNAVIQMGSKQPELVKKIIIEDDGDTFESGLSMAYNTTSLVSENDINQFIEYVDQLKSEEVNINYSVQEYVRKNRPQAPLTSLEKYNTFIKTLNTLCLEYDVELDIVEEISDEGKEFDVITLTGGVLLRQEDQDVEDEDDE